MSEDLISRKAAIDAIWDGTNMDIYTREVKEILEGLPSAPPVCIATVSFDKAEMEKIVEDLVEQIVNNAQQKTGRWIPVGYDGYADGNPVYEWWECSKCGWEHEGDENTLTAYCPNCGAENGGGRISNLEKAKEVVKAYYRYARCGIFDSQNIAGDETRTIFEGKGLTIDICFNWSYFEVFGLNDAEFEELEEYYYSLE